MLGLTEHRWWYACCLVRVYIRRQYVQKIVAQAAGSPWRSFTAAREFGFTLAQVNWFSNVLNLMYLPASVVFTLVGKRWGVRVTVCHGLTSLCESGLTSIPVLYGFSVYGRGVMDKIRRNSQKFIKGRQSLPDNDSPGMSHLYDMMDFL